ncbi:MAG: ATP-dependent Clp protease ATP-binding subunit ClpA [Proteobacteria bacterium]|nr:ATP-dependent Clp protease ATP-binding subunit ClpA [Pseudomonadota bacterium]
MLSRSLEMTLHRALSSAREQNHEYATLEHLLLALIDDDDASLVLSHCGANTDELREKLEAFIEHDLSALVVDNVEESKPTAGFQRVIHRAALHVHAAGKNEVNGAHVLTELFSERESHAVFFLQEQKVNMLDVVNYLAHGDIRSNEITESKPTGGRLRKQEDSEEAPSSKESESIAQYAINLNKRAKEGKIDALIGREEEIERTIEILCRRSKNNPLLVGDPGVGKTAIAEGLAYRIVKGDVPEILKEAVIYSLDMGAIVAGTRYRGDFEERFKGIIKNIEKMPHAVLFIDEIHTIIGAGATSGGSLDAGNLLKPALARGSIKCIGSTTYKEYRTYFEKDRALLRRFQKIDVKEPSVADSIKILHGLKGYYEKHHGVSYTEEAIKAAVNLSNRYITDRKLPDKAIDIIDEAGAHQALKPKAKKKQTINVTEIEAIVAKIAHIPSQTISADENLKLATLEADLKAKIYGQDKAIESLVASIKLSKAGLRKTQKPIGCYLFTGPTGVGKTELAVQLALRMNMHFLRVDMSEYMEQHSVARLIGSPPGYVGFEQGGIITDDVDKNPYSVVLLDEMEKAHGDIYNILLQVMDYGKLTDNSGKVINFANTIVIMTSNVGAKDLAKTPIGFGRSTVDNDNSDAIKKVFSPEFRNRLDATITFKSLSPELMEKIVDKFISEMAEQLADKGVGIEIGPRSRKYLAEKGYDPLYGARPLERFIEVNIKKHLAEEILFGKLKNGGKVKISFKNGEDLDFTYETTPTTVPQKIN